MNENVYYVGMERAKIRSLSRTIAPAYPGTDNLISLETIIEVVQSFTERLRYSIYRRAFQPKVFQQ